MRTSGSRGAAATAPASATAAAANAEPTSTAVLHQPESNAMSGTVATTPTSAARRRSGADGQRNAPMPSTPNSSTRCAKR